MTLITVFVISDKQYFHVSSNAIYCIWKAKNFNKRYSIFENYFLYLNVL